jgi:hypothetical protein
MEKKQNGGARPGAGRPRGSTNKVTAQDLLAAAEATIGKPFVVSLVEGYKRSIDENNNKLRVIYEKMIIDKVVADRHNVEVEDSEDTIAAKQAAFTQALAAMMPLNKD